MSIIGDRDILENMKTKALLLILICWVSFTKTFSQLKLDKFEDEILQFEQDDQISTYKSNAVLFTGSSSIRRWESLAEDMSPIPVINRGFGGSKLYELHHYANRIFSAHDPTNIVVYCGENDFSDSTTTAEIVFDRFTSFCSFVQDSYPNTHIHFISIKPSIKRWIRWPDMQEANELIQAYAQKESFVEFIDVTTEMLDSDGIVRKDIFVADDLHLNAKGYAIWTRIIKESIREYVKP